ncbi:MAG: hypothetical protein V1908_01095, partial [Candidatus Peregrinibacteria bacterium]
MTALVICFLMNCDWSIIGNRKIIILKKSMKWFWKFVYIFWPNVLRAYEVFFHHHRQNFLIGRLITQKNSEDLKSHLAKHSFEHAIIA